MLFAWQILLKIEKVYIIQRTCERNVVPLSKSLEANTIPNKPVRSQSQIYLDLSFTIGISFFPNTLKYSQKQRCSMLVTSFLSLQLLRVLRRKLKQVCFDLLFTDITYPVGALLILIMITTVHQTRGKRFKNQTVEILPFLHTQKKNVLTPK